MRDLPVHHKNVADIGRANDDLVEPVLV
jgi:hypothetical protein